MVVRTDHADIALTGSPASESEREPALATEHLLLRIIAAARRSTRRISATSASKCFILVRCGAIYLPEPLQLCFVLHDKKNLQPADGTQVHSLQHSLELELEEASRRRPGRGSDSPAMRAEVSIDHEASMGTRNVEPSSCYLLLPLARWLFKGRARGRGGRCGLLQHSPSDSLSTRRAPTGGHRGCMGPGRVHGGAAACAQYASSNGHRAPPFSKHSRQVAKG